MTDSPAVSPESRAMLARLVAHDTTSRNSNLELIEDVRGYLSGLGVASELVYESGGGKANLYATLGPTDRGGIALSGHTDVVPVDGQDWSSDPFRLAEADGHLYARGACDMKGFLAVALAHAPRFLERGLQTPIHLCLSYDEEVGCIGVRDLLEVLASRPTRPRAVVIGEPTDMQVVTAHKGKLSMRCRVRGRACHSALAPQGVNAVEAAARLAVRLSDMGRRKAAEGPFDAGFDVPYTTVHCGVIRGGSALNIVPEACSLDFEFRNLPREDPEALLAEVQAYARDGLEPAMQAVAPESGFAWERLSAFPGLDADPADDVVHLARRLAGANATAKVAFGTEGGLFQQAGMPAVVCGPGSIEQAHKADEFVSAEQLGLCEHFMERLLEHVAA